MVQRSFSPLLFFCLYFIFVNAFSSSFVRPCSTTPPDRNANNYRSLKKSKGLPRLPPTRSYLLKSGKFGYYSLMLLLKFPWPSDSSIISLPLMFCILRKMGCCLEGENRLFPKRKAKFPKGWMRCSSCDESYSSSYGN